MRLIRKQLTNTELLELDRRAARLVLPLSFRLLGLRQFRLPGQRADVLLGQDHWARLSFIRTLEQNR